MPVDRSEAKVERRKNNQQQRAKELSLIKDSISDVLSAAHHSKDFIQTRNRFIVERLRLMCIFFAISVPLFSSFDFIFFAAENARVLFVNRIFLSISLFVLYKCLQRFNTNRPTRIILSLAFIFPVCFYIATSIALEAEQYSETIPLSFSMMPYLIVAMLGLYPLTIRGGVTLLTFIAIPLFIFEYLHRSTNFISLIDQMWLLMLFGGIALWLQTGQLLMLMKLYRESTIDPLTGLINRRVLMRQVTGLSRKTGAENHSFSVMMLDLDCFKRVNDTYGHMVGDMVLVKLASILKKELRSSDITARFGGEEFLVVMPNINLQQANYVAERIASIVRKSSLTTEEGDRIRFTTSVGVAEKHDDDSVDSLFKRVDELLYRAKEQGRDRVVSEYVTDSFRTLKVS